MQLAHGKRLADRHSVLRAFFAARLVCNGSKAVRLRTSKCLPVCAEKQTQGGRPGVAGIANRETGSHWGGFSFHLVLALLPDRLQPAAALAALDGIAG